jgi:hypothetical protein
MTKRMDLFLARIIIHCPASQSENLEQIDGQIRRYASGGAAEHHARLAGSRPAAAGDHSQFYRDLSQSFYCANKTGAKVSQGILDQFWLWSMQCGLKNAYESIKAFSETHPPCGVGW